MNKALKIAIIQKSPAYLNLSESLVIAKDAIETGVSNGAQLIVFGETWLSGYPAWLDHLPNIALWDHPETKELYRLMWENAIEIGDATTQVFQNLVRKNNVHIVIGVNEKISRGRGNGSIYNSLLFFDPNGELAIHHRKLMPTFTEKLVYNTGDGAGLKTINTPFGNLGGLICWEHWMPLSRQVMHDAAEQIHVAVWPAVHEIHQMASRHYAFEGRCFVIAVGQLLQVRDLPGFLSLPDHLSSNPEKYLLNGGSCIIGPDGKYIVEPQYEREGIIYHELENLNRTLGEKMTLDVTGHYFRPDVFSYAVNKTRKN